MANTESNRTALHQLHLELGGRMTAFAGWDLPARYGEVIAEHLWCRDQAALFDVSHMAIVDLHLRPGADGADGPDNGDGAEAMSPAEIVAQQLETVTPAAVTTLAPGRQRYSLLTNDQGGVIDDFIVTNQGDVITVVLNAARRQADLAHISSALPSLELRERTDLALLAVQGPKAVEALRRFAPDIADLVFLDFAVVDLDLDSGLTGSEAGVGNSSAVGGRVERVGVSRSGYTGEDGFELMVAAADAERLARALLAQPEVNAAGLGARDTLRLEAGLALYGNDLDETTSPIEADLAWTIPKRRRADRNFPGAERIMNEVENGPDRRRVGLRPEGRRPVRGGATLRTQAGEPAGVVTSGGFGPSIGGPVAMGYVTTSAIDAYEAAAAGEGPGLVLVADVRGSDAEVVVAPLPFSPHNYHRGA